jgi:hypothetical protein
MGSKGAVTNPENYPPTPVAKARERLEKALDELDSTLDSRAASVTRDADSRNSELNAVTDENARLRKTNETVSKRLDAAIGRLRAVLEG